MKEVFDKNNLTAQLIHPEGNEDLLSEVPHSMWNDLAVIYCMPVDSIHEEIVDYEKMKELNVTLEEMNTIAYRNLSKGNHLFYMQQALMDIESFQEFSKENLNVIMVGSEHPFGAIYGTVPDVVSEACKALKTSEVYIIPSSIHEMLIVPKTMNLEAWTKVTKHSNETQLESFERLSNNIYSYDDNTRAFAQETVVECPLRDADDYEYDEDLEMDDR